MRQFLANIFDITPYDTLVNQNRAKMVYGITTVMVILFALYIFFVPTSVGTRETYQGKMSHDWNTTFYVFSFYFVAIFTYYGTRLGRLEVSAWGPSLMWVFGMYLNAVQTGVINAINGTVLFSLIVLTGLLKGRLGLLVGTIVALGGMGVAVLLRPGLTLEMLPPYITSVEDLLKNNTSDFFSIAFQMIGGAGLVYLFLQYASVNWLEGAVKAIEDRQTTAQIVTHISRQVARRAGLRSLLAEIVEQINSSFDFIYHTQVFLIDDTGRTANLVASTGAVGRILLEREHSLGVGSASVIGHVTLRGEHLIAQVGGEESVHRRNELLPDTVVEAAFPLRMGDKVIGALDVQSRNPMAFSDVQLVATFQALADSTSLAIDNVSQFEKAESQLRRNAGLIEETRSALHEVERLNEQLTGRAWSEYLRGTQQEYALATDFETAETQSDSVWTPSLQEALRDNHLVQHQQDDQQVIAIPLRVRGRVVGAMEFELDQSRMFTPDDFDLVQEVGDRFSMALEGARLMDESRRAAQREALVNQISSRLQSSNNIENMLNEAARGLRNALKANKVAIRLGKPPSVVPTPGNGSA